MIDYSKCPICQSDNSSNDDLIFLCENESKHKYKKVRFYVDESKEEVIKINVDYIENIFVITSKFFSKRDYISIHEYKDCKLFCEVRLKVEDDVINHMISRSVDKDVFKNKINLYAIIQ